MKDLVEIVKKKLISFNQYILKLANFDDKYVNGNFKCANCSIIDTNCITCLYANSY